MPAGQHLQRTNKQSFNSFENCFGVLACSLLGGLILYPIECVKVRIQSSPSFSEGQEVLRQYSTNLKLSQNKSWKGVGGSLASLFIAGTFALASEVSDISCIFGVTLSSFIRTQFQRIRVRGQLNIASPSWNSYFGSTFFLALRDASFFLTVIAMNRLMGYQAKNETMLETNRQWFIPVAIATALSQPFDVCLNKSIASAEEIGNGPAFLIKTLAREKLHIVTKGLFLRTFINLTLLQVYFFFVKTIKQ